MPARNALQTINLFSWFTSFFGGRTISQDDCYRKRLLIHQHYVFSWRHTLMPTACGFNNVFFDHQFEIANTQTWWSLLSWQFCCASVIIWIVCMLKMVVLVDVLILYFFFINNKFTLIIQVYNDKGWMHKTLVSIRGVQRMQSTEGFITSIRMWDHYPAGPTSQWASVCAL